MVCKNSIQLFLKNYFPSVQIYFIFVIILKQVNITLPEFLALKDLVPSLIPY